MARRDQRTDRSAWVLGVGLPVGLLFAIFSLLPEHDLTGRWPLHIAGTEVEAYARWFDQRGGADSIARCETYTISDLPDGPGWRTVLFEAEGRSDSVEVRPSRTISGAIELRFGKKVLFRGQRRLVLAPASLLSIRAKYEELIATELGLVAPAIALVRVAINGDTCLYVEEAMIDGYFLQRQRLSDAVPFEQAFALERPDHLFPEVDGDAEAARAVRSREWNGVRGALPANEVVDADAVAALLLMVHIADRGDLLTDRGVYSYGWGQERIMPLYPILHDTSAEVAGRSLTGHFLPLMRHDPGIIEHMKAHSERLADEVWRLKERFNAVDRDWLPLLTGSGNRLRAQAVAQRIARELLDRIGSVPSNEDRTPLAPAVAPSAFMDAMEITAVYAEPLEAIAARLGAEAIGDSLMFRRRGKYVIDQDLFLPKGVSLVLEKSVRLEIGPGVDITVQGAFIARGTPVNPVFIRPLREDSAYGTIAVNASVLHNCLLRGVRMSGGSGRNERGFRKGMLSIRGAASTTVEGCDFQADSGRAVLAIEGGDVRIKGSRFTMSACDGVVATNALGSISQCMFNGGGDGVVQRGGRLLVEQCRFEGMQARALSAGSASQTWMDHCTITGARVALAVKDQGTVAHVSDCAFTDNALVFQARGGAGGGSVLLIHSNTYSGNAREREVEAPSSVEMRTEPDASLRNMFGFPR